MPVTYEETGAYNTETGTYNLNGQKPSSITFKRQSVPVMQPGKNLGDPPVQKLTPEGTPIYEDTDYVTVRQPGGVDSVIYECERWIKQIIPSELSSGRLSQENAQFYMKAYRMWKENQEVPVMGVPIKTWPVMTPSQIDTVLAIGVRTVEELADLPDDGVRRLGMGGIELKNKAKAWLAASKDHGKLTNEMVAIQKKNELLEANLATLTAQLDELKKVLPKAATPQAETVVDISDAFDEPPKGKKK